MRRADNLLQENKLKHFSGGYIDKRHDDLWISNRFSIDLQTRSLANDLPAYTLRNYLLICTAYNEKGQPVDSRSKVLPDLAPGAKYSEKIDVHASGQISRVWVEVFRPTGYSVLDAEWLADNTIKKDTAEEYLR